MLSLDSSIAARACVGEANEKCENMLRIAGARSAEQSPGRYVQGVAAVWQAGLLFYQHWHTDFILTGYICRLILQVLFYRFYSQFMNRKELSTRIADRTGLGFRAADDAVKAFAEIIAETLSEGETVRLQGFGTFKVIEKATRQVYNPVSGMKEERKPEKVPVFKAADALKERVG